MESMRSTMTVEEKTENAVCRKVVDPLEIDNQSCLAEEKCSLVQSVDLYDMTLSSFNDFLLGNCSYCENVTTGYGDPEERTSSTKQLYEKSKINSVFNENSQNENSFKPLDLMTEKTNVYQYEHNVDSFKSDNVGFYHVFEIIKNPVTQMRKKDVQDQLNKIGTVKSKSHKTSKWKKKQKMMAAGIRKGQRYLPNFKQKVLDYASNHTFKATALHFNINCNTITEWARENKRLSPQQKSTTSMPASVCHFKTELVHSPATKTDIILVNDSFTIETELNGNVLKTIEQDLPLGDMRSDERFMKWIQNKRLEKKELTKNEVNYAAQYCLKKFTSRHESPLWFKLWLKRYNKSLQNSDKSDETEKYIMYPNNFKVEVALYAKLFTKNSAARVFNVPRRRIFDWFKYSAESHDNGLSSIQKVDFDLKKEKSRKKIDTELHDWYKKRFSEGFSPTSTEIRAKAREVFAANGVINLKFSEGWLQKLCKRLNIRLRYSDDDRLLLWILAQFDNNVSLSHQEITEKSTKLIGKRKQFKGSKGWTLRFLKRHSKFLQQVPTIKDKLPDFVQTDIREFCSSFRFVVKSSKIKSSSIGCMDEIPICFNYPNENANPPLLRKTGFENCQAVAFLCMTADGRMLPPAVVLRGTEGRQIFSDGNIDMLILYQEDGAVDLDVVGGWVADVWLSCVSAPSIIVVDSFKPHCRPELKDRLTRDNAVVSVIPEGCSSQLQPLDVDIAQKFRDLLRKQWKETDTYSRMDKRCRCPDRDTILRWIGNAYREIAEHPHSIINSFKVVGLVD